MPLPQIIDAQRDFSAGELDPDMKRRDDQPIMRAGARQMADWRVLNSGQIQQRSGRRYRFAQTGRVDEIEVAAGLIYRLCFGADGTLKIRDSNGALIVQSAGNPWAAGTIDQIVWTQVKISSVQTDAVICFPNMQPVIASYDGVTPWAIGTFSFATGTDGIKSSAFLRLVQPGATITPSAGGDAGTSITLVASADVFLAGHIGTNFRFANSRMNVTAVADTKHATATLLETMNPTQKLTVGARTGATGDPKFIVGQSVSGSITGTTGVVVQVDYVNKFVWVQLLSNQGGFSTSDILVGPTTSGTISVIANVSPLACAVWDEEIISTARGWPQSCFTDRGRLGFCDIPAARDAIMWSATNLAYYFAVGANPTDAMVEVLAGKPHIYHVGASFDEVVFTSKGIFYIPIGSTNVALKPGSVEFRPITNEASSSVKPAFTSEGFLYVNAGRSKVNVVVGSGASNSTRPYVVADVTRYHKHLFTGSPKAIAISTGDGQFPERYAYVLNADGTLAIGRYEPGKDWIGWLPWKGLAVHSWVSALFSNVLFTVTYAGVGVTESLDESIYIDCAQAIAGANTAPWLAIGSVTLMDGVNTLGPHLIDAGGNVVKVTPGEDLTSPTLLAGFPYTPTFEPFIPDAEPGPDQKQRTKRRRIGRVLISVMNSTGFMFAKLYSGPAGAKLPAIGSVTGGRRVSAFNQGDDQSQAPPLREQKYSFRGPTGHNYDPRFAFIKDTSGPLRISEVGMEAST